MYTYIYTYIRTYVHTYVYVAEGNAARPRVHLPDQRQELVELRPRDAAELCGNDGLTAVGLGRRGLSSTLPKEHMA